MKIHKASEHGHKALLVFGTLEHLPKVISEKGGRRPAGRRGKPAGLPHLFRKLLLATSLFLISATSALAQPTTYSNPVLPGDFPDPSVIRVGEDYWATATSSEWGPLFPILHSRDLVNWELVTHVFPRKPI